VPGIQTILYVGRGKVREVTRSSSLRSVEGSKAATHTFRRMRADRGHLVPRSDMNRLKTARVNSFFLTNM